ncbi:hypothetical protein F4778DRAFT_763834 [Xylariomycetidae sp. FL2044]|nr:hypothetical protein F4778DRAFT_763834 [Xylariomycetidae sp. FL2044]
MMGYSENMSPESTSSLFPERPIRPLPKRRLRERLSPEVADTIEYPPAPQTSSALFIYPYNSKEDSSLLGPEGANVTNRENVTRLGQETGHRRNMLGSENGGQSLSGHPRRSFGSRPLYDAAGQGSRGAQRSSEARHPIPQAPPSTASSADGYDSFENTNNKKKRKIPTAGESILNGTHTLNDLGILGIPSPPTTGDEGPGDSSGALPAPYYQSGGPTTNGQGISGPGRGRYGRVRNGRSPLRTLSDPNSNWPGRIPKTRPGLPYPPPPSEISGIISTAIASAEKLPVPRGQENISLLHQSPSKSNQTSSAQFTFTFDSQNPVSWPGSDPLPTMASSSRGHNAPPATGYGKPHHGTSTKGTQTSAAPTSAIGTDSDVNTGTSAAGPNAKTNPPNTNTSPKKSKRRGVALRRAAEQRSRETQYQNKLNPPPPEERWVCEFCEYKNIFGEHPEALIRQYEIKDRKRRHDEVNRRRMLEKAKKNSRKGKKASKPAAKNTADRNNASIPENYAGEYEQRILAEEKVWNHAPVTDGFESEEISDGDASNDMPDLIPASPRLGSRSSVPAQGNQLNSPVKDHGEASA